MFSKEDKYISDKFKIHGEKANEIELVKKKLMMPFIEIPFKYTFTFYVVLGFWNE